MEFSMDLTRTGLSNIADVLPIAAIIFGFHLVILRQRIPNLRRVLTGFFYVLIGLTLFLVGLEESLFPLGKLMARQLTNPEFLRGTATALGEGLQWYDYKWVYLFSAAIGFATTIAEPALIAVAIKAHNISGGTISVWGLRVAVAIGVAIGITLGAHRIVTGAPLYAYISAGYFIVLIQTVYAPRPIIALAYDSGGVTTSTVTVPIVAALGLGLAGSMPGRSALLDGFGLIAFASLFPIVTVLGYAQIGSWWLRRETARRPQAPGE
jgi:hypothetical protein